MTGAAAPSPRRPSLLRSTMGMASGTMVSRILGLVRTSLQAAVLGGMTVSNNAWETANTLPNMVYLVLAGGMLNAVLVPQLVKAVKHEDGGRDYSDRLLTIALTALFGLTAAFTLGAGLLTWLYTLDFDPAGRNLAIAFAFICMPQVFFYGLYSLLQNVLVSRDRFVEALWAPAAANVVGIVGLVAFLATYPRSLPPTQWSSGMIWLLAGTSTLGVAVQALILLYPVWRSGFRYTPRWGFRGVGLRSASTVAGWALAVVALSQVGLLVVTNVLNSVGKVDGVAGKSIHGYAFLIYVLPHSLVAVSLVTALYPRLARAATTGDNAGVRLQTVRGLRLVLLTTIPVAVVMYVLAPQVTAVIFPGNTPAVTSAMADVVRSMLFGLPAYGVYLLVTRAFYAYEDGRRPFGLQVVMTVANSVAALAALALPPTRVAVVIGIGTSVANLLAAGVGLRWLSTTVGGLGLRGVWVLSLRATVASVTGGVAAYVVSLGLRQIGGQGLVGDLLRLILGGLVFVVVTFAFLSRMRVPELATVVARVARRIPLLAHRHETRPQTLGWAHQDQGLDAGPPRGSGPSEPRSAALSLPGPVRRRSGAVATAGDVLGARYELLRLLSDDDIPAAEGAATSGSLSREVWVASDKTLGREVNVTLLPTRSGRGAAVLDAARRAASVADPRLTHILDMGSDATTVWVVTEALADARSLADLSAAANLPVEEARRIVGETASALEVARHRGVHHQVLTPTNVMVTSDGRVKVTGLAYFAAAAGMEDDNPHRTTLSDTTALAGLLYVGLVGRWPLQPIPGVMSVQRVADGRLPSPSELRPGVPADLDALARQLLAGERGPAAADPDATVVATDLSAGPTAPAPTTPGEVAARLAPWSVQRVSEDAHTMPAGPVSAMGSGPRRAGVVAAAGAGAAGAAAARGRHPVAAAPAPAWQQGYQDATDPGYGYGGYAEQGYYEGEGYDEAYDESAYDEQVAYGRREYHSDDKDTGSRRWGLLLIIALVALGLVGGVWALVKGLSGDDTQPVASNSPTSTATRTSTPSASKTPTPTTPGPVEVPSTMKTIVDAKSYDPLGDMAENQSRAALMFDSSSETYWRSLSYRSAKFSGEKAGVGIAADLGEVTDVSQVKLDLGTCEAYPIEVYVGSKIDHEAMTQLGTNKSATGEVTFTAVGKPIKGQYVLVWYTDTCKGPAGDSRARLYNMEVR